MYGLRKINKNGIHYGFQWPLEVGAIATAPDWNPNPTCGGGLHVLPNAQGEYVLLDGHYWAVVEFDESDLVMIGSGKGKVPSCKIVHISESTDGLLDFFRDVQFDQESAYWWAKNIGDREHMKQLITDSQWAYHWACSIDDCEHMKQFVTDSYWAYHWARNIGDCEHMKQFVTDPGWAYKWARDIGDREHMKQFVTDSRWAYYWARYIGDREHMRQFVTESEWAYHWACSIGDCGHMKQFITDSLWTRYIGG